MNGEQLQRIIKNTLNDSQIYIKTQDNVHFNAVIISRRFEKIGSKVKQQRLIYNIINEYIISGEIHAISMKTYTPDEWKVFHKI